MGATIVVRTHFRQTNTIGINIVPRRSSTTTSRQTFLCCKAFEKYLWFVVLNKHFTYLSKIYFLCALIWISDQLPVSPARPSSLPLPFSYWKHSNDFRSSGEINFILQTLRYRDSERESSLRHNYRAVHPSIRPQTLPLFRSSRQIGWHPLCSHTHTYIHIYITIFYFFFCSGVPVTSWVCRKSASKIQKDRRIWLPQPYLPLFFRYQYIGGASIFVVIAEEKNDNENNVEDDEKMKKQNKK